MSLSLPTCLLLFTSVLLAQPADLSRRFEVASVKPATPGPGPMAVAVYGGPGSSDPGRFTAVNSTLLSLIIRAYDVPSFRLDGPSWLSSERFNILASVPAGATREQFLAMLQNLLAERFHLVVHEEERQAPVFALVIDKRGLSMKKSRISGLADSGPQRSPTIGKDGIPIIPAGQKGLWRNFVGGRFVIQANQETIADLAGLLSDQLNQPVSDETGLTGPYDFTLEFWPLPVGTSPPQDGQVDESGPSIFSAVKRLGLRLDPRKRLLKMVVVDRIEKTPTAN